MPSCSLRQRKGDKLAFEEIDEEKDQQETITLVNEWLWDPEVCPTTYHALRVAHRGTVVATVATAAARPGRPEAPGPHVGAEGRHGSSLCATQVAREERMEQEERMEDEPTPPVSPVAEVEPET